jgi:hypothetical protein
MTTDRRAFLRSVMKAAWQLAGEDRRRRFADCLRDAWRFLKRTLRAPVAQLSPLLYRSPTVNRSRSRYGAYKAAYVTARVGW